MCNIFTANKKAKNLAPDSRTKSSIPLFVLAATYSCLATTIGADGLNCRVRNENGCNTVAKPPGQKEQCI